MHAGVDIAYMISDIYEIDASTQRVVDIYITKLQV